MECGFKKYEKSEIITNHLKMGGKNPLGEEIYANSLYFTRGGKPWIGVMGEYHFVRDNRENWYDVLCKMKAGGISVAATYIFWIYHEEEEGIFNFEKDRDLRFFVKEAKRAGMDVFLRIGPWAHGECRNGGFPDWLVKKPFKLRESNAEYMQKVKLFYEKIYEQVGDMLFSNGGNIIGIQIENELSQNAQHLLDLKNLAVKIGFKVPIYTVTGWSGSVGGAKIPEDEMIPVFGGYASEPWLPHTNPTEPSVHYNFSKIRNDSEIGKDILKSEADDGWCIPYERYPFSTCEIGGGVEITHLRRPIISAMDVYAISLVKLGSGNNLIGYYMYKGGTNKIGKLSLLNESKETDYPNDYTAMSYDFQAPISEYGEIRESYRLINLLHMFVNDFGDILAPMENVMQEKTIDEKNLSDLRYAMRTDGKSGFVFVNHYVRNFETEDCRNVVIKAGNVEFEPIDVCGKASFIMPFNMDLSGCVLKYATAQLVCKTYDNTYFFCAVEKIEPKYIFEDGSVYTGKDGETIRHKNIKIVTVSQKKARFMRKLSGNVYIGTDCDIYEKDGEIQSADFEKCEYDMWNGDGFEHIEKEKKFKQPKLSITDCEAPFEILYPYELNIGNNRTHTWKKIEVSGSEGFVEITQSYDAVQIYANKKLVADNFYFGKPWRIPAKLLFGKECYMVMSDLKDDFYKEF